MKPCPECHEPVADSLLDKGHCTNTSCKRYDAMVADIPATQDFNHCGQFSYMPWTVEGVSEPEYWKRRYLEARKDALALYSALAFIRDCEDDDELGVSTNRSYLKNQAAAAMEATPL